MADDFESKTEGVSQKSDQELVKIYKRRFENWREVLIYLDAFFSWEKPFFPAIIVGIVTTVFLMLWYFDPSVLSTLAGFGILMCVIDYAVPMIGASLFDSSKWTGTQERKYEEVCFGFVNFRRKVEYIWLSVSQIKDTKPYLYFIGVLGTLVFIAWIGNQIDNLFLLYLIVLFCCLLPGIRSHPLLQAKIDQIMGMIGGVAGQSKKKN